MTDRSEVGLLDSKPIAVGGLGGSGTRVVAQVLLAAGIQMGTHLNGALDNLMFTSLLKNPTWRSEANGAAVQDRLALFGRCTGGLAPRWRDVPDYMWARRQNRTTGIGTAGLRHVIARRWQVDRSRPWGWKEPNTHVYLRDLPGVFDGVRYVHVIRDPRDMALSENLQQLANWGALYGVSAPERSPKHLAEAQFRFSLAANTQAVEEGRQMLGARFLLVHFETLCRDPEHEIKRLLDFAEVEVPSAQNDRLVRGVRPPRTMGRHLKSRWEWVTEQDLLQAKRLGYDLTRARS